MEVLYIVCRFPIFRWSESRTDRSLAFYNIAPKLISYTYFLKCKDNEHDFHDLEICSMDFHRPRAYDSYLGMSLN